MQSEKPTQGLATPNLVMSRVEVERCGGAGVDSGHNLMVGNVDVGSTSTQRGTNTTCRGRDRARRDEAEWAWRGMEHGAQ